MEAEIKKDVKINNVMQLIDLNDNRKSFQAEFIVQSVEKGKSFKACIVNQDQLDNGQISFEECNDGKYARRVTYQEPIPLNHYIALKSDQELDCRISIRLVDLPTKSIPPPPSPPSSPINTQNINLPPQIDEETREQLGRELEQLSNDKEYQNLRENDIDIDNDDIVIDKDDIDLIQRGNHEDKLNHWIVIGIICLIMCLLLFLRSRKLFPFHSSDN